MYWVILKYPCIKILYVLKDDQIYEKRVSMSAPLPSFSVVNLYICIKFVPSKEFSELV